MGLMMTDRQLAACDEDERTTALKEQVHALLDECQRLGVRNFRVPETERASDIIANLHYIVGRQP